MLIPEISNTQMNCHDYPTISPYEPLLKRILFAYPMIDYIILIGTGGLKVRYIDSFGLGRSRDLATVYASEHELMTPNGTELCRFILITFFLLSHVYTLYCLKRQTTLLKMFILKFCCRVVYFCNVVCVKISKPFEIF